VTHTRHVSNFAQTSAFRAANYYAAIPEGGDTLEPWQHDVYRTVVLHGYFAAPQRPRGKEDVMLVEDRYTRFVAERVKSQPLTSGDTLYWDGMGVASQGVGLTPGLAHVAYVAWLVILLVIGF